MTDNIEEIYLTEAVRRFNSKHPQGCWTKADYNNPYVVVLGGALKELGWKPPIDQARMDKARKVAAAVLAAAGFPSSALLIRDGREVSEKYTGRALQAAYDALGE